MNNPKYWYFLIPSLMVLLVWLAFFWQPEANREPAHNELPIVEVPKGGDFTLQSPSGPVSLADHRGKVVLLYFGYTFCPDVCPTSLAAIAQALSGLTPAELDRVAAFFITVDPERDTLDVLKTYIPYFHPRLAGLTGTPDQIAAVAQRYGVRYMKQKPDANSLYSVDHSASTYLIDRNVQLAGTLPHGLPPQQILERIRTLLKP